MLRMRTIDDTAAFFRSTDPETRITASTLRRLIASGQITTVKAGNKNLLNLDCLIETLAAAGAYTPAIRNGNM